MKRVILAVLVPALVVAGDALGSREPADPDHRAGDQQSSGMMGGGGMMGGSMEEMHAIHGLLMNHKEIQRSVEDIPNGVKTITTSKDPQVTDLIRQHVWQMKDRIEQGGPIRQGDPLFRELFKNHQHIHIAIEKVEGGVAVTETADDPKVTPLIRQHARRAVSEFVAEGMPRVMRPTPLPPGYVPQADDHQAQRAGTGCWCMNRT